jgi:hypothetical protein
MSVLQSLLEALPSVENNESALLIGGTALAGIFLAVCLVPRRRTKGPAGFPPRPAARQMIDLSQARRGSERRSNLRRYGSPTQVYVSDIELSGDPLPGWVVDRSSGGLGLMLTRPLEVDNVINVRAANVPESTAWVQVRVRHCRPTEGGYQVGCKFQSEQPWRVMLMFG